VREVYEEVGASVSALVRMGDFVTAEPDGGARRAAVFHARFAAAGPIPPQSESAEAAWFTMEEVRTAYWRWDALMERMFTYASTFEEGVAP
jgi:8-oxo-dGTP pyrophosphatase MutT (NUDIX family)